MKVFVTIMFFTMSFIYGASRGGNYYNSSPYGQNQYYNDQYNGQLNYDRAYRLYRMGNLEDSLSIFASLCEQNNFVACLSAGIVQGKMLDDLDNQKISRSKRKQLKNEYYISMMSFYTKACNGGNYDACNNLAFYQQSEKQSKQDEEEDMTTSRAMELYAKACKAGNKDACQNLGVSYSNSIDSKDTSTEASIKIIQAQNYYGKSCTMGDSVACFNLGVLRYNYAQSAADYAQSIQFFNQACNADYPVACLNLGIIYERGVTNDIEGDIANAMQFYTKACSLSNADACSYLSKLASRQSKAK